MTKRLGAALLLSGIGLAAQGLVEGHAGSPVRVIIYEDLQCPDCANFRVMLDKQILPKYGDRVEFVHRDFPLAKHAWARRAAIAARFFTEKDPQLGLEYRRHTMATHSETTADNFKDRVAEFARQHGVKPRKRWRRWTIRTTPSWWRRTTRKAWAAGSSTPHRAGERHAIHRSLHVRGNLEGNRRRTCPSQVAL